MSQKKRVEILVVKERTGELTFFNQLMKGFRLITETAFFISIGIFATAWERIEKILKSKNDDQTNRPLEPSVSPESTLPEKVSVKVPLLPIDDYQQLKADQIIKKLEGFSRNQLELIREFESSHKKRKSVLEAVERSLSEGAR